MRLEASWRRRTSRRLLHGILLDGLLLDGLLLDGLLLDGIILLLNARCDARRIVLEMSIPLIVPRVTIRIPVRILPKLDAANLLRHAADSILLQKASAGTRQDVVENFVVVQAEALADHPAADSRSAQAGELGEGWSPCAALYEDSQAALKR